MNYKGWVVFLPLILVSCVDNTQIEPNYLSSSEPMSLSLCKTTEVAVVSCQVDEPQGRMLSICHSNETQKVHYRIGIQDNINSSKEFTKHDPLLRWVDSSAYTTYFGFEKGEKYYSIGVPQETQGAKVFMDISNEKGQELYSLSCVTNSFEQKILTSPAIIDLSDEEVYKQGVNFPYDYYKNRELD